MGAKVVKKQKMFIFAFSKTQAYETGCTNFQSDQEGRRQADIGNRADRVCTREEIGIHAIRMGNIVGEHEVMIGTPNQTITLKHEAHSRALFAEGALAAAAFLVGRGAGMYDMKSLINGTKIPQKV